MIRRPWSIALLTLALSPMAGAAQEKWVSLLDGKTMSGWEFLKLDPKNDGNWTVKDGMLVGTGSASMLYSPKGDYKNFKVRAEVKINDGGNSGFYFRAKKEPSFTVGYEAQVDSTHTDPIRTGSIYGMVHVYEQHQKPDEWFTYELEVKDGVWRNKPMTAIKVKIDGKELYEFMDFDQTFKSGHFAFQGHDPGSTVMVRKVEVMELP